MVAAGHRPKTIAESGPYLALAVILVVSIGALAGLPQWSAALAVVAALALLTWFDAFGGLCLLLFSCAFFLGESYHPWYFLLPLLCCVWFCLATLRLYRTGQAPDWAVAWPIALLPLSALISVPLMVRELYWTIQIQSFAVTAKQLLLPSHTYPVFGLTFLAFLILVILMVPVMTACLDQATNACKSNALQAYALLVILYCLTALVLFNYPLRLSYLGASLYGLSEWAITGLAYNRAYFGTWLTWSLPLLGMAYWGEKLGPRYRALPLVAILLIVPCIGLNGQKANLVAVATFLVALFMVMPVRKNWLKLAIPAAGLLVVFIFDLAVLNGFLYNKLVSFNPLESVYAKIWQFALALWQKHWLLGAGTGSFADYYLWAYGTIKLEDWYPLGNAHSQWLQLLAEQGILGALVLFGVFAYFLRCCLRVVKETGPTLQVVIAFCGLALAAVSGLWQTFLHIRSFVLIWAFLLAMAITAIPLEKRPKIGKRGVLALSLVTLALMACRGFQIYSQGPMPDFRAGFYEAEKFEGGRVGSWMTNRAVWVVPASAKERTLRLDVVTFLPGLSQNPQELDVRVGGGEQKNIKLPDNAWRKIDLSIPASLKPLAVHFKAKYKLNPARQNWSKDNRDLSVVVSPKWIE